MFSYVVEVCNNDYINQISEWADPHLSDHAVPLSIDVLSMPPIGHQVQVIGETHNLCQSLEDVDAEAFAAVLHGPGAIHHQTGEIMCEKTDRWDSERAFYDISRCFTEDALTWMCCLAVVEIKKERGGAARGVRKWTNGYLRDTGRT